MLFRASCVLPLLRRPDFFFLQAAVEPLDVTVAFRMMVGRAAVRDAQLREGFQEPGRSELCAIVRGQRQVGLAAAFGQPFQHGLFDCRECVFGPAAVREIPAHDLPRSGSLPGAGVGGAKLRGHPG